jgi:hypothetical protein
MVIGRHAGEPDSVGDLPIGFSGLIVIDSDDVAPDVFLPELRSAGIHVPGMSYVASGSAVATGTVGHIDLGARLENVFAGAEWGRFCLAVDAGVQGNANDLPLKRERRVGCSYRWVSEAEVEKNNRAHGCDTEQEAEEKFAKTATAAFFCHLKCAPWDCRPSKWAADVLIRGAAVDLAARPEFHNSKAKLVQE